MSPNYIPTIPAGLLITAGLSPTFVAQFALFIAIILTWTIVCGKILKRLFNLPIIAGRIIAGILLGPSLINIAGLSLFAQPLNLFDHVSGKLYSLVTSDVMLFVVLLISAALTVSYLLWIAGHETDLHDVISVGPVAVGAGIFGAIFPIIMIAAPLYYVCASWSAVQAIGMGLIFAATSVSIPVAMLFACNKMHLKSSKATLAAAVVDDIVAVILLALFTLSAQMGLLGVFEGGNFHHNEVSLGYSLFLIGFAFIVMSAVGYYIVRPSIEFLKKSHLSHLIAPAANVFMLVYFAFAELIGGLAGITGAYFAGLFHRMGDHRHAAEKVISPFVNAFLLPLFLGSIGLQLNMRMLGSYDWVIVFLLLFMAIMSKIVGCFLATGISNFYVKKAENRWTSLESYLFGSSMIARGEVGLIIATILFGAGILLPNHYAIAIVVIVLTTIATPIMLAIGFERLSAQTEDSCFSFNIGKFTTIGTTQMFHIISGCLERSHIYKTTVHIEEGYTVISFEDYNVKILLNVDEGIIFEGERGNIRAIVMLVRDYITHDIEMLEKKLKNV